MEIGYFLVKTSLRWLLLARSSRGKNRCVYPSAPPEGWGYFTYIDEYALAGAGL